MSKYIDCRKTGIYFLLQDEQIVYIGATQNFPARIAGHFDKKFNRIRFIQTDRIKHYENRWMRRFKPKYNCQLFSSEWRSILIETGHFESDNARFKNY